MLDRGLVTTTLFHGHRFTFTPSPPRTDDPVAVSLVGAGTPREKRTPRHAGSEDVPPAAPGADNLPSPPGDERGRFEVEEPSLRDVARP